MAKFSVKKPLTVFVAVVVAFVLGIVSYTNMTPDLLPNIDLPYVLVSTMYIGASPEAVEEEVSKPLEQAMATLDDIETVSSTSNENYSLVILQFADGANLDTVTVDILQKINTVSGSWSDTVGTPTILKINPNMLPVSIAAVDMEGMDTAQLSEFVNDTLQNKLEGINGVASVDTDGLLEEQIVVELKQDKIDVVNAKIFEIIEKELKEKEEEALDTKNELEERKTQLEGAQNSLGGSGDFDLGSLGGSGGTSTDGFDTSALDADSIDTGALADGRRTLTEAELEIQAYLKEIDEGIAAIDSGIEEIDVMLVFLDSYNLLLDGRQLLQESIPFLAEMQRKVAAGEALSSDELEFLAGVLPSALIDIISLNNNVVPSPLDDELVDYLDETITDLQDDLTILQGTITEIETQLVEQGISPSTAVQDMTALRTSTLEKRAGLVELRGQIEQGAITVTQAQTELQIQIDQGVFSALGGIATGLGGMADGMVGLTGGLQTLGGFQMASALTQLEQGLAQVNQGLDQLDDARESALKQADLNNVITMDMVSMVLTAQNMSMPTGYVEDADGESILVSVGDAIGSYEELENLVLFDVGMDGMDPVYLLDVADIYVDDNADEIYANINGNTGVLLSFSKQSNYATAEVSDNINDAFADLEAQYPGLKFTNLMDQGDYIYMVVWAVIQNLLSGAVLAVIVLFLFLRNWRPTIITLVSIPISVLFAFTLMYFSGVSINMFSLSGLAVAVGMLVDNSVVVIENIYRLRDKGVSSIQAAISGAHQVGGAIMASTLTTVAIFMPIVFIEGLTRQLFTDFALTFAYALIASLVVALTVVPSMSSRLLAGKQKQQKHGFMDKVLAAYSRLLKWVLNHKLPVLAGSLALLILSAFFTFARGYSFMPDMDMGQLTVTMALPEEATFEEATAEADIAVDRVYEIEGVETVGAMVSGGGLMGLSGGSGGETVTMYVLLDGSTTSVVGDEVIARTEDLSAEVSVTSSSGMDVSALGGSGITVELYGDDMDSMQDAARLIAEKLGEVEGVASVDDGIDDTNPEIHFAVDKEKAMEYGLTVGQVIQEISAALSNETTSTSIKENGESFDVVVQDGKASMLTPEYIKGYQIETTNNDGDTVMVPIGEIAEIVDTTTMESIWRTEGKRYMSVTAEVEEGYNVSLVTQDAEAHFADVELGGGMYYEFSGENETIMEAMEQLVLMLLLGILLVYLIMVAQFQSLKSPFIVMFTIPLAFTGGLLALLITGNDLSVISVIGFVMLVGIIVNNGIVLVDYINQLRTEGTPTREAIIEAGVTRMRPILMTSITTIFGLFTMAIGVGTGTDIMQPIAIVCIGGLLYATLLTLFVVPAMYELMNRKEMNVIDDADLEIINE